MPGVDEQSSHSGRALQMRRAGLNFAVNSSRVKPGRLAGHPIHAMLIPFPIALFVSTFVDLICWQTNNNAWATASLLVYWLERVGHGTAWVF
jgi:uncharacterized membrane protein